MTSFESLQSDIARAIGFDITLVNVDDDEKHLDSPEFLFSVAAIIIAAWCKGFLEAAAKDLGDKVWKGLKERVTTWIAGRPKQTLDLEDQDLGRQVFVLVREIMVSIQDEKEENYREHAEDGVVGLLKEYNFPPGKADQLVRQLEKKLRGPKD